MSLWTVMIMEMPCPTDVTMGLVLLELQRFIVLRMGLLNLIRQNVWVS